MSSAGTMHLFRKSANSCLSLFGNINKQHTNNKHYPPLQTENFGKQKTCCLCWYCHWTTNTSQAYTLKIAAKPNSSISPMTHDFGDLYIKTYNNRIPCLKVNHLLFLEKKRSWFPNAASTVIIHHDRKPFFLLEVHVKFSRLERTHENPHLRVYGLWKRG